MIRFSGSLLALAFAAMLATQTLAASTHDAINATNASFAAALNRGNATKAATFYAEDAAVFPPESLRIDGRSGIEAYWKGAIDAGVTDVSLKAAKSPKQVALLSRQERHHSPHLVWTARRLSRSSSILSSGK